MTDSHGKPDPEAEEFVHGGENEALAAWRVPDPPAGFADRVLAVRSAAPPIEPESAVDANRSAANGAAGLRRVRPWAIVGGAAIAALFLGQLRSSPAGGDASGSAAPTARQSIQVGRRAVAVAEAGAALSWQIEGTRGRVTQTAGDVFYRVESGGSFEVNTAHGSVRVAGTCFRVELNPMKTPWQGLAGAAIGAALVVTVYEGSVLFAGRDGEERQLSAGQVLSSGQGGVLVGDGGASAGKVTAAGEAAALPAPPEPDASRDELLRRDAVQRTEIASLRSRVRALERGGGRPPGAEASVDEDRDPSGRPWFDPSVEDLARFAAECRVRSDMPRQLLNGAPFDLPARWAAEAGVSEEERAELRRVMGELGRQFQAELRALYIEVTGDAAHADDLSAQAMMSELREKSPEGEAERILRRIAQERAGMVAPPADLSRLSPLERSMRREASLGDEAERRAGEVLGAQRAHDLRAQNGGWGARMEMAGCPGDEEGGPPR